MSRYLGYLTLPLAEAELGMQVFTGELMLVNGNGKRRLEDDLELRPLPLGTECIFTMAGLHILIVFSFPPVLPTSSPSLSPADFVFSFLKIH